MCTNTGGRQDPLAEGWAGHSRFARGTWPPGATRSGPPLEVPARPGGFYRVTTAGDSPAGEWGGTEILGEPFRGGLEVGTHPSCRRGLSRGGWPGDRLPGTPFGGSPVGRPRSRDRGRRFHGAGPSPVTARRKKTVSNTFVRHVHAFAGWVWAWQVGSIFWEW